MDLSGRVAIVTGGGTGIGRATSLLLAGAGARVVVGYSRSEKDATSTVEEARALGTEAIAHQVNIADEAMVGEMVAASAKRFGRLDFLVNNAGTTHFIAHPDLDALTDGVWDDILSVNLKGTFFCCRAAASELKKANGAIVNVSSIAAHRAAGSSIPYAVSKAAIVQLTRSLALALAPGVRVNSVSPGLVATRWTSDRIGEELSAKREESFVRSTPTQKIVTPGEVGQAIIALLLNEAITGQDLVVDGGKNIVY
ncbi:MAG TPA: SDR family oxidoreductase [Candidatus Dormibacteraeota bacterium]